MESWLLRAAEFGGTAARNARAVLPGLAGAALVCWGVALIYVPAALILAGVFLLLLDGRA
ncbi:hypothetical protein [Planobispora takensis]|uniref:Uncharacterized protein n=1 Tax=Planobispora takensis TaxID=1367882 RepID=A0A8J3SRB9_9ACTN|nr:hypothetical protein [Planobispora takensis]GIH98100.1 hypothetical protein Pta02_01090 [Planobispora takensis]